MKKLIAFGLLCLLFGCSKSPIDEHGRPIAERSRTNEFNVVLYSGGGKFIFHYIMVDGHEYIVMTGCHISGLTHSPRCSCVSNFVSPMRH